MQQQTFISRLRTIASRVLENPHAARVSVTERGERIAFTGVGPDGVVFELYDSGSANVIVGDLSISVYSDYSGPTLLRFVGENSVHNRERWLVNHFVNCKYRNGDEITHHYHGSDEKDRWTRYGNTALKRSAWGELRPQMVYNQAAKYIIPHDDLNRNYTDDQVFLTADIFNQVIEALEERLKARD